ncbi:hypothetical protein BMT54_07645 [Pasteurellaceae bacterium 15-036681]|nr:hypothetical protein BMT54_07645 [Pasteurellaceae bacterium 15-036681]
MFKQYVYLAVIALFITGCSSINSNNFSSDFKQKEKLYQTTENYVLLVDLYRNSLQKQENDEVRYKLADSYYNLNDGESTLIYLKPLLSKPNRMSEQAKLLQIRALILIANYNEAIQSATSLIQQSPKNSEAYNLRGVSYANVGDFNNAYQDIISARENFINDSVALNNLAMLHILSEDYNKAVGLLMPQYLNGVKPPKLVYNLVLALVKAGRSDDATKIIEKENLSASPKELIESLRKVKKTPMVAMYSTPQMTFTSQQNYEQPANFIDNVNAESVNNCQVVRGPNNLPVYKQMQKGCHTDSTYTVGKRDTVYLVSFLTGASVNQIAALNNLRKPYQLRVGRVLQVR